MIASIGEDPPVSFDVSPLVYEKKIPLDMRRETVIHFQKHLMRGMLSGTDDDRALWKDLGVASKATRQDR